MKTAILFFTACLIMMSACEKKNITPGPDYPAPNAENRVDTSRSGYYKMISCSNPAEMDLGVEIHLLYKKYKYYDFAADTNDKIILYWMPNNVNSTPGSLKISKTIIYRNQDINHNQPYIETRLGKISAGFISDPALWMNGSNKFLGDTMVINFHVDPPGTTVPQYDMQCKYLKH